MLLSFCSLFSVDEFVLNRSALCLQGRGGRGSIYVFAAGNGGLNGDSCAYNGYVNSIYTIAINGLDVDNKIPGYAENCAAILACTYSKDKTRNGLTDPIVSIKIAKI